MKKRKFDREKIFQLIKKARDDGGYYHEIAQLLDKKGHLTYSGGMWTESAVRGFYVRESRLRERTNDNKQKSF